MNEDQYQGIRDMIQTITAQSIKENVNGKIDRLGIKLDEYIHQDNEWKKQAQPVIDLGNNARGASTVALYIAGFIIAVGGAWEIIRGLFKK